MNDKDLEIARLQDEVERLEAFVDLLKEENKSIHDELHENYEVAYQIYRGNSSSIKIK
jgi:hypothetical protein